MMHADDPTSLTNFDLHLFHEGTHRRLYEKLGAHPTEQDGSPGTRFAVWAPRAEMVSVIGRFNEWSETAHPLQPVGNSGIWQRFVPQVGDGELYKFHIESSQHDYAVDKADPFAFSSEVAPQTASRVCDLAYEWNDTNWMNERHRHNSRDAPLSIYQLHLGSWPGGEMQAQHVANYRQVAERLARYVTQLGFTHVELLPIMLHASYRSWGNETIGHFAPCSRYGSPQELMYLIDFFHQHNLGVILEWVPGCLADDPHGMLSFDGDHLYERAEDHHRHAGERCLTFDLDRNEVCSFLYSVATFWLENYHIDGLYFGDIGTLLYPGQPTSSEDWRRQDHIDDIDLRATYFLQRMNEQIEETFPDVLTIAHDSSRETRVTWPVKAAGGLGFTCQRNVAWLREMLDYLRHEPEARKYHHDEVTKPAAWDESLILPISHEAEADSRGPLLAQMPGEAWEKFANLRLLLGYMYALPGKKLLFMGNEFGRAQPWHYHRGLDWFPLEIHEHAAVRQWVEDLNRVYRAEPCLHPNWTGAGDFEWIDSHDELHSIVSFCRRGRDAGQAIAAICNFMSIPRTDFRLGIPHAEPWKEILNSDATIYGGTGCGNPAILRPEAIDAHGRPHSIRLTLPPLSIVLLRSQSHDEPH